jgi:hypothetical protein
LPQLPSAPWRWLRPPLPRIRWGWGGGWGGYHHHFGGFGIGYAGGGYGGDGCYVVRRVPTPFGYRLRTINFCEY